MSLTAAKEHVSLKDVPQFLDVCNKCYTRMSPVMENQNLSEDEKILEIFSIGKDVGLF